ncbi:MAG: glutaredoxin family protein [Gammaproteobacteria bacterium]|nr:glutaredoxin family protein [Gammaproteobacteria bacterium]
MLSITLYSTENCHLCEEALTLCQPYINQGLVRVQSIDIVDDDELYRNYAIRIPVLKREDSGNEMGWPFDDNMLQKFLV